MTLISIFRKFRFPILLVMVFVLLENVAWIIEPNVFGKLLDAMIDRFTDKQNVNYLTPLFIWATIYLMNVLGGSLARLFGGRFYPGIYAELGTEVIKTSQAKGKDISISLARAEMARTYIEFFQYRLPDMAWQFFSSFGAIAAMFLYDWRIAAVCSVVIVPIIYVNKLYNKHVTKYQGILNDTKEELFKVIGTNDASKIDKYYKSLVMPESRIANWSSSTYGIIKVLLLIIFIVILYICVDVDDFSTGKIYSIVAYLWTFISSTEYLPGLMESFTAVKDINTRLED